MDDCFTFFTFLASFPAKGTKTEKLCVKATWEVINPIKCYERGTHFHVQDMAGTSSEITIKMEFFLSILFIQT